jgi:serine/threonine protein kinase
MWRSLLLALQVLGAAKGMLALHKHTPPIVHRDVKSPNFLVKKDWTVKVCDFNLCVIADLAILDSLQANNPRWLAPEVLEGARATLQSVRQSVSMLCLGECTLKVAEQCAFFSCNVPN